MQILGYVLSCGGYYHFFFLYIIRGNVHKLKWKLNGNSSVHKKKRKEN